MGTATVQTQHAADRLGLPLDRVRFEYGDSSLPWAGVAGGSSQTISVALAVQEAAAKLVKELLSLARKSGTSPLAEADANDVQSANSGLFLKDMPAIGESYVDILRRAGRPFVETDVTTGSPLEIMKYSMHSYAASQNWAA